jgi:PadR family transcriptional regulator, regulatory protein PadR
MDPPLVCQGNVLIMTLAVRARDTYSYPRPSKEKRMATERGDLLRGTLEMLILRSLEDGRMHGYGITERLQRVSEDVLTVDEGSLYPALYRMQKRGWLKSEWGRSENNRKARYYSLTAAGRKQLRTASAAWERFSVAVAQAMEG